MHGYFAGSFNFGRLNTEYCGFEGPVKINAIFIIIFLHEFYKETGLFFHSIKDLTTNPISNRLLFLYCVHQSHSLKLHRQFICVSMGKFYECGYFDHIECTNWIIPDMNTKWFHNFRKFQKSKFEEKRRKQMKQMLGTWHWTHWPLGTHNVWEKFKNQIHTTSAMHH